MPKFNPGDHVALHLIVEFDFKKEYDITDEHIKRIKNYIVSYIRRHCVVQRSN